VLVRVSFTLETRLTNNFAKIITIHMNINSFRYQFLNIEIQSFKDYINFIEENFEKFYDEIKHQFKELEKIYEDDPIKISEENEESDFDYMMGVISDKNYEYNIFQQRYRSSVIIQLYIFFETQLTNIVDDKNDDWNYRETFLENAKRILKEKIDISKLDEFIFLRDFTELRNFIVHNNTHLADINKKNIKRINSLRNLNKRKGFKLKIESFHPNKVYSIETIEKEFLLYSLEQMKLLLDKIYSEILKTKINNI